MFQFQPYCKGNNEATYCGGRITVLTYTVNNDAINLAVQKNICEAINCSQDASDVIQEYTDQGTIVFFVCRDCKTIFEKEDTEK